MKLKDLNEKIQTETETQLKLNEEIAVLKSKLGSKSPPPEEESVSFLEAKLEAESKAVRTLQVSKNNRQDIFQIPNLVLTSFFICKMTLKQCHFVW